MTSALSPVDGWSVEVPRLRFLMQRVDDKPQFWAQVPGSRPNCVNGDRGSFEFFEYYDKIACFNVVPDNRGRHLRQARASQRHRHDGVTVPHLMGSRRRYLRFFAVVHHRPLQG